MAVFLQKLLRGIFGNSKTASPSVGAPVHSGPLIAGITQIPGRRKDFPKPPAIQMTGKEQLERLTASRVTFLLLDLRIEERRKNGVTEVLATITDKSHPIVVICETGEASLGLAKELEKHDYINLFVVTGGMG